MPLAQPTVFAQSPPLYHFWLKSTGASNHWCENLKPPVSEVGAKPVSKELHFMSGCILAPWISTRNQAMQWKGFVGESAAWPSHIFQCSFLSPNKNAPDVWMDICWKPQSSWFCFEISMPTWKGCPPRKNANVPWVDMLIFTAATFAAPCGAELQRESRPGRLHGFAKAATGEVHA